MKRLREATADMARFGELRFLYVGTDKFEEDLAYYSGSIGARVIWNRRAFGARVAALSLGEGPLWLLADHRPPRTCLPIFEVKDLRRAMKELKGSGAEPERGPLEIPNGPCCVFRDRSGNEFAIFQDVRPGVMG